MSRTVWKYTLHGPTNSIEMPAGSTVLDVANQEDQITFWAEVDTQANVEERIFVVLGTGHSFPATPEGKTLTYIGSAHGIHALLVFHVYELVNA